MAPTEKEPLDKRAQRLKEAFSLTDFSFDTECIYQAGDLSSLLEAALVRLLPEHPTEISEILSEDGQRYVAIVSVDGQPVAELFADTYADFLPDDFIDLFEGLPERLGSGKRFFMINWKLTGQALWYFCGFPNQAKSAQAAGLPVVLPGDDWLEQDVSEYK